MFAKLFSCLECLVTLRKQIILILLNFAIAVGLILYAFTGFVAADKAPVINPYSPAAIKDLGITTESFQVETGIYIENFHVFDLTKNNFVVNAIVWFSYDPTIFSLETIGKFSFEKGDILSISKPETRAISKNELIVRYQVKIGFTTNLYYRLFPLDDHRLFLVLTNKFFSPKECIFVAHEAGLTLSPQMEIPGWRYVKHGVETGYSSAQLERTDEGSKIYHPVVVYAIDFERDGFRQITVLFLPLFIIFYLALIVLALDPEQFGMARLTLGAANVSGLIGYRFVIEVASPVVGYFMVGDLVFNLFLALVAMIFLFNLSTSRAASAVLRGAALLFFHGLFLFSWAYIFIYWVTV